MCNSYWITWQIDKKLKKIAKFPNVPSQDVWKFTPVSYRTLALWSRCPALTPFLQPITPSRASGTADHVRSLYDLLFKWALKNSRPTSNQVAYSLIWKKIISFLSWRSNLRIDYDWYLMVTWLNKVFVWLKWPLASKCRWWAIISIDDKLSFQLMINDHFDWR